VVRGKGFSPYPWTTRASSAGSIHMHQCEVKVFQAQDCGYGLYSVIVHDVSCDKTFVLSFDSNYAGYCLL
jgi:hypothetical protein